MTTTQPLVPPTPTLMFGLTSRGHHMAVSQFLPLICKRNIREFVFLLEQQQHNVKCLAKYLLRLIYEQAHVNPATELLKFDLPQEEVLFFLWLTINDRKCSHEVFTAACAARRDLLQLHMDFSHRVHRPVAEEPVGFPVLCVVQSFLSDPDACIRKLDTLVSLGADVNARYVKEDEETAVHFAARNEEWKIVEFLLEKGANIDIIIKGTTARDIILKLKPELINNVNHPIQPPVQLELKDKLFNALYDGGEEDFVKLLNDNNVSDVNLHDGRTTLLQLAIVNKFVKVADVLIQRGADVNLMAGNSKEPILLAMHNPNFAALSLFSTYKKQVNFLFSVDGGTFLNALAIECNTRYDNINEHRLTFMSIIEEAIRQKVHISALDKFGSTALEVLGYQSHNNSTLFNILLRNGGFLTIDENIVLNTRPEVFTTFFDEHFGFVEEFKRRQPNAMLDRSEILEVTYDFLEPLESYSDTEKNVPEMLPFFEICKSEDHQKTLLHPIVTLFLVYKWRKIAFIYILNFFLYFLFTMMFSFHIYDIVNNPLISSSNTSFSGEHNSNESTKPGEHLKSVTIFLWCLILLRELFQIFISYRQYLYNLENYLEINLLIFSFLTFFPQFSDTKFIAAVAIALTYIELTLLIGRHPYTGTYITMFLTVSFKSIELLLIFSSFIFAFTFGFYVFFHNLSEPNLFNNIWHSVLKTSVMTAGEFNVESINFKISPGISEIMFLLFIVFVPIVLMNLLNALAVSDTQRVIDETALLCCVANIRHYTKIESMWLGYSMDKPGERCYGFAPGSKSKFIAKIISLFRSLFRVNVLPFPQNPYINPEPTHTLKILIDQKYYYPYVYMFYKAPTLTSSYKVIKNPKSLYHYLIYFYFRILLRGNEDISVGELRLRKYPSLTPDVNECIDNLNKSLSEAIDSQLVDQKTVFLNAIENVKANQNANLSLMEENIKTKLSNQNFINMERVIKHFNEQDAVLKDIKMKNLQQENEITRLSSEISEVKLSMQQISSDLAVIKGLLTTRLRE